jgi:uncharacterized protein (TIGR01244 family)
MKFALRVHRRAGPEDRAATMRARSARAPEDAAMPDRPPECRIARCLPLVLALLVAACASDDAAQDAAAAGPPVPEPIVPADIEGLPDAMAIGDVVIAGQPTPMQFAQLAPLGFVTVINLRPGSEMGFPEEALMRASGLKYVHIPFTPTTLSDDDVTLFLGEMSARKPGDGKLLIHCSTGNRSAALWAIWEITHLHVPVEEAVKRARAAGLKSPELVGAIGEYARRAGAGAQ